MGIIESIIGGIVVLFIGAIFKKIISNRTESKKIQKNTNPSRTKNQKKQEVWDLFISYAYEDRDFASELVNELGKSGLNVWYDNRILKIGDNLVRKINYGLNNSKFGLVILSEKFFLKEWPKRELETMLQINKTEPKSILPIWHNITLEKIKSEYPIIASVVGINSSEGVKAIVKEIINVIKKKEPSLLLDQSESNLKTNYTEDEEKFLIEAFKSNGNVKIIYTDQARGFVVINEREFISTKDPQLRVRYLDILDKFVGNSLIIKETDVWFVLSDIGFEVAKRFYLKYLWKAAWEKFKIGEFDKSIQIYQEIISEFSTMNEALESQKMIGIILLRKKEYASASNELKKAIDKGSNFPGTYYYYGFALSKNNKNYEAKKIYKKILDMNEVPNWVTESVKRELINLKKNDSSILALRKEINKKRIKMSNLKKQIGDLYRKRHGDIPQYDLLVQTHLYCEYKCGFNNNLTRIANDIENLSSEISKLESGIDTPNVLMKISVMKGFINEGKFKTDIEIEKAADFLSFLEIESLKNVV